MRQFCVLRWVKFIFLDTVQSVVQLLVSTSQGKGNLEKKSLNLHSYLHRVLWGKVVYGFVL